MKKIGIMGGTFDPIHNGHLIAAEEVLQALDLDEVIFMPAGASPLKNAAKTASARHRHIMCVLATYDNPKFSVSTLEIDRAGITYTVDTLAELKDQRPHDALFFIVGADVIKTFSKWKNFDEILRMCKIVAVTRGGVEESNFANNYYDNIIYLKIPDVDISSSNIRTRLAQGKSPRYLLPQSVLDYICKEGLYGGQLAKLKEILRIDLSAERFAHSLSVLQEAENLGQHHGLDEASLEKLRLAALLHDCAKNFCDERPFAEINALCHSQDIALDDFCANAPWLAHSFAGAALARAKYGVTDAEVLSAIACHTFGKPNMSIIDKIIYIADFIEVTRPNNEARSHARTLAYKDLDAAMKFILRHTIDKTTTRGLPVHKNSYAALKDLEDKYGTNG